MRKPVWLLGIAALGLAACEGTVGGSGSNGAAITQLPEAVLALAAPYQDLTSVRIDEADGCYYYRHVGPVETTYLPLRSTNGRPICTRAQGGPAPAA